MRGIKKIGTFSDNGTVILLKKYEPNIAALEEKLNRIIRGLGDSIARIPPTSIPMSLVKASQENPVEWSEGNKWREVWWIFKGNVYKITEILSEEHIRLLVIDAFNRERNELEGLKQQHEGNVEEHSGRIPIPESVRIEVWRRDGGKCVKCGSRVNLEFDHIIPVSKGGSNTARNIELLCEKHNRSKGAKIV
ncbi:MAG: HNH endonuclease [Chloroflexi bacterium]|nr:HNH endonuclease [Chloroflexota bacterium]